MHRRTFLELSSAGLALNLKAMAEGPMPAVKLGRSGLRVSRFVLGGYHMAVHGEETGVRIIHRAIDLGVNLLDNAHLYHKGRSEEIYGKALGGGLRRKVLLMSKAHLRERDSAMCTPTTSWPASTARAAATAESTPPLMAANTRMGTNSRRGPPSAPE